jgi:hypothetical protein
LRLENQRSEAPAKAPTFQVGTFRPSHVVRSRDAGALCASTIVLGVMNVCICVLLLSEVMHCSEVSGALQAIREENLNGIF